MSLVGAVPAGFLTYFMIATLLNRNEDIDVTMLQVLVWVTLSMSTLVTVLPIGILIFGPKTEPDEDEATDEQETAGDETGVAADRSSDKESTETLEDEHAKTEDVEIADGEVEEEFGDEDFGEEEDFGDDMEVLEGDDDDIFDEGEDVDFEDDDK